ncbi:cytochrome bd oxidase small subunit CydS [Alkalibacillus aidingensis]
MSDFLISYAPFIVLVIAIAIAFFVAIEDIYRDE